MKFLKRSILSKKFLNEGNCISKYVCSFGKICSYNMVTPNDFKNSCTNLMVCVPKKKGFGAKIVKK